MDPDIRWTWVLRAAGVATILTFVVPAAERLFDARHEMWFAVGVDVLIGVALFLLVAMQWRMSKQIEALSGFGARLDTLEKRSDEVTKRLDKEIPAQFQELSDNLEAWKRDLSQEQLGAINGAKLELTDKISELRTKFQDFKKDEIEFDRGVFQALSRLGTKTRARDK